MKMYVEKTITKEIMMFNNKIINNLSQLKLNGFISALEHQLANEQYEDKSFLQRLDELVLEQISVTSNLRIDRLLKQSNIRWKHASISGIDYQVQTSLKQSIIEELAELEWLKNQRHLIITGPTGTGKTYLASAFGMQAIMSSIPVILCRFNDLILKFSAAENDKRCATFKRKVERVPLLIIDDWGTAPLSVIERHLLFELIEKRDQNSSLIITSQFPVGEWYDGFGDPTVADSTLDRIVHSAHKINMKGESFRRLMGIKGGVK
jgi:DNA replication protein DnaC